MCNKSRAGHPDPDHAGTGAHPGGHRAQAGAINDQDEPFLQPRSQASVPSWFETSQWLHDKRLEKENSGCDCHETASGGARQMRGPRGPPVLLA